MTRRLSKTAGRRGGSTLIEFALVALLLCLLLLFFVDFARLVLVYDALSNAARAGVRYAIVHGSNRTGAGVDGPSGPGNTSEVETVVRNFAGAAPLDQTRLTVTVTYGGSNAFGSLVQVRVDYPFDPFIGYFPVSWNLRSRSEGRVVF